MKNYSHAELTALAEEYFVTLDDTDKDEWYATNRKFAEGEVSNFLDWLASREKHPQTEPKL